MRLLEHTDTLLTLRPDRMAERRAEETRRATPWLVGGLAFSVGLWLLLRTGRNWPALAPGGAFSIAIMLVIYLLGGTCGLMLVFMLIQSWLRPLVSCVLDRGTGVARVTAWGFWNWMPARQSTYVPGEIGAILLWNEHEGPVWPGLQIAGKRVKLGSSLGNTTQLGSMITTISQLGADSAQSGGAGQPLSTIAEKMSQFLAIPLIIDLGAAERLVQLPQSALTQAEVIPINCPRCGAPLPGIRVGMGSLQCAYCGTNMRVVRMG
jgi:hypothetical protein